MMYDSQRKRIVNSSFDPHNKNNFLIDTAADISINPNPNHSIIPSQEMSLCGKRLQNSNLWRKTYSLGLGRKFGWAFVVADLDTAILGADFIVSFAIIINF